MGRRVCRNKSSQCWANLWSMLTESYWEKHASFFSSSPWRGNTSKKKIINIYYKPHFPDKNTEVLNGWVTCQTFNNSVCVQVRPEPIQNYGTFLDHLLSQVSFKALKPSLSSSSQPLSKVLLSSSFHRWKNWDSERLSNMPRVSQQGNGPEKSQGFSPSTTCCGCSCCGCNTPTPPLSNVYYSVSSGKPTLDFPLPHQIHDAMVRVFSPSKALL